MDYALFRGVNQHDTPHILEDGQFSDMQNMRSTDLSLTKRPGFEITDKLNLGLAQGYWPIIIADFNLDAGGIIPLDPIKNEEIIDPPPFVYWDPTVPLINLLPRPPIIPIPPQKFICLNCQVSVLEVVEDASFTLTITAFDQIANGIDTAFDGTGAVLRNSVYDLETFQVTNNPFELAGGGPIDISDPGDWTNGVWQEDIVLPAANNPLDLDSAWLGAEVDDKFGETCRLPVVEPVVVCLTDCTACVWPTTLTVSGFSGDCGTHLNGSYALTHFDPADCRLNTASLPGCTAPPGPVPACFVGGGANFSGGTTPVMWGCCDPVSGFWEIRIGGLKLGPVVPPPQPFDYFYAKFTAPASACPPLTGWTLSATAPGHCTDGDSATVCSTGGSAVFS